MTYEERYQLGYAEGIRIGSTMSIRRILIRCINLYAYIADARKLTLSIDSNGFNYEWLMHMGASTKQETTGEYAGFFGEGFKVASLCALRDHGWKIQMRSKNWSLEVVSLVTKIDGKDLQQLAYQVKDNLDVSSETVLKIEEIEQKDAQLIDGVVYGFYYPENL